MHSQVDGVSTPALRDAIQRYAVGPDEGHPGWNEMVPSKSGVWVRIGDVEAYLREHDRELLQAFLDNGVYGERWKVDGYNEGYAKGYKAGVIGGAMSTRDYAAGYARALADAQAAIEAQRHATQCALDAIQQLKEGA